MNVDLNSLRSCAEDACQAAQERRAEIQGAVNWGDLGCVEARSWRDNYGTEGLTVFVEEADPGSVYLHAFIREYLADRGWAGVEVATEW